MHRSSTRFPQGCLALVFGALLALQSTLSGADSDALLFRIFLKDGGVIVSYGEFARVSDRVVLSVPLGDTAATPQLQLLSISEGVVDWEKTDAYTRAVRARRYAETRGEDDYALLLGQVTNALNDLGGTPDPVRRLAMALEARRNLAAWPAANFGFKAAEVAQLVSLFDEAIADLRASAGETTFDLSLVANTQSAPLVEVLPPPDARQSLELALAAAKLSAESSERAALLRGIAQASGAASGEAWGRALQARVRTELAAEEAIDAAYSNLSAFALKTAHARALNADVRGLQDVIARVLRSDQALGRKRPGEAAALLATLEAQLDQARRLRLARDAWILRRAAIRAYRENIAEPLRRLDGLRRRLSDIRELSGPDPRQLKPLQDAAWLSYLQVRRVTPPAEMQTAHQLLSAALQMARQAALLRRDAVSSNDSRLAWDASAAAAGAMTLRDRAVDELQRPIASQPTR